MTPRCPKRSPSPIKWLVLMLALMNAGHGEAVKPKKIRESPGEQRGDDCPTHEDSEFPDSVRVQIQFGHTDPSNAVPQDVRNRSLSPWDYRIDEDPNRYPPAITEARCRYKACVNSTGRGLNYNLNAIPIQQEILVIRRRQTGSRQSYWLEKQTVTVGCTCAFPSTSTSTNLRKNGRNNKALTRTSYGLKQ